MTCNAEPYEGKDKYVFFSYAHKDKGIAYGMIERMVRRGFRVWYDSGLHPGDDWPEVIGEHLQNSAACICLMTKNSMESHNCKNELNYAVESGKTIIPILVDDVRLSPGVKMQIGRYHQVKIGKRFEEGMLNDVFTSEAIQACRGLDNHGIELHDIIIEAQPEKDIPGPSLGDYFPHSSKHDDPEEDEQAAGPDLMQETPRQTAPTSGKAPEKAPRTPKQPSSGMPVALGNAPITPPISAPVHAYESDEEDEGEKTIVDTPLISYEFSDDEKTMTDVDNSAPVVICMQNGLCQRGQSGVTKVGRGKTNHVIVFPEDRTVGREHITLVTLDGKNLIRDQMTKNGTVVNGERLESGSCVEVGDQAEIIMSQRTVFVAFGQKADDLWSENVLCELISQKTRETLYFYKGSIELGRKWRWKSGAMSAQNISKRHATLYVENGVCTIEDHSQNGTYVNDARIEQGKPFPLSPGDRIRMGDEHFVFESLTLEKR